MNIYQEFGSSNLIGLKLKNGRGINLLSRTRLRQYSKLVIDIWWLKCRKKIKNKKMSTGLKAALHLFQILARLCIAPCETGTCT